MTIQSIRRPGTLTAFLLVPALWLAGASLCATVLVPADLVDLAEGARAILHGRVTRVEPRWTDDRRHLETLVRVAVAEYLKGDLGAEVTFKVPAGEMGTYRTVLAGAPTFVEGEEVVLFLNAQGPSIPYVLGLSQGVFRVVAGSAGDRVVVPTALLRAASPQRVTRGDPARRPMSVSDFAGTVRAVLAGRSAAAAGARERAARR